MKRFKMWMAMSSTADKEQLAALAGVGKTYLYQLASGYRVASSEVAGRIATASREMFIRNNKRTDILRREDISPVCAGCPYSPGCKK